MISLIIPTWNEALMLPETLAAIRRNDAPHEVMVADAGSADGTAERAEAEGCRVIRGTARHRARQMNLAVAHARGETLFFLHADTRIPANALQRINEALADHGVAGGGFRRRFVGASPLLRFTCALADLRGRWLGWHLGDQGIFARRAAFESMGGFHDLPVFEDLDFCRRLKQCGRVICLSPPVYSSGRRFAARGAAVTTLSDLWLTMRYLAGADPSRLAGKDTASPGIRNPT